MKEFKEYVKAKLALEKELANTQEILKQTLKEMLLLRNDDAFNQNANDEVLKSIEKNWKITASLEGLSDTLEIKILEQSVSYNRFYFEDVLILISNFLSYEEQKAIIEKLGFSLNKGE
ncbi:TPA: hypothetical protein RTG46_000944 [Campylobacter jejuni]|nr:hypothetical protein [Campylobacter jejuni]HDZ5012301.1 hypothetical protein [Campylobacter jejuni]HDZ5015976.1 hypothetical protein [Campylobacter jejuni]HDZ5024114.1 hypothetical protein [Campylobacter jejuni]HDZ5032215.1 hypothetical protein [Campylobacter jejuni]